MSVTIKDIAEKAGVSFSTVSKALRGSPLVQESTRLKVCAIAEQMGYQPNYTARRLVSRKSGVIGVVWPSVERAALSTLITHITDRLENRSITTMLSINEVGSALAAFRRLQVDAVLLFPDRQLTDRDIAHDLRLPILQYGVAGTSRYPTIDVQRGKAIDLALQHILWLGHKRIAYLGQPHIADPLQTAKIVAYRETMRRYGLPETIMAVDSMEAHDGYLAAKAMLSGGQPSVSAIVCGSYDLTRGLIRAAQERGVSIPGQLSVVCYDNFKQMDSLDIPVTAVGVHVETAADRIAETLVQLADGNPLPDAILLEPELAVRSSSAVWHEKEERE